ncbi:MAG: glycosyltransferase [Saccharofermentans sp.]|nr:glycosyltransferase [Saccharofermentans sp.]
MSNKEKNFVSAVVYVHNAQNRIEKFLKALIETFEENFENSEIILVNDYSSDGSVDVIKVASKLATCTSVSVVNMSYFHGLEVSMKAGVDLAIGDFVFEFDNTVLDFEKAEIMKVYNRSLEGYDIVSASPNKKQKRTSNFFYYAFAKFSNIKYEMKTESFRILSRRVINRIASMNKTTPYRKAIYANCGLKTDNINYEIIDSSIVDTDNLEKSYRSALAVDSLILFTDIGYTFAKGMTLIMILATIFVALYSITIYLVGTPVEGWTTTILFLAFAFFGLFGILTIIIKYLQIIVNLIFKRKSYNFESIDKLTK